MRLILLSLIVLTGIHSRGNAQSVYNIPDSVKRVLFLGNSITWNGEYVNYLDAYFRISKQKHPLEIINVGLPSETVSGLSEPNHAGGKFPRPDLQDRLMRVLETTKPDWVFACYGMNDGIYMPFDDERFNQFKEGIIRLHREAERAGIHMIHVTPPIFDERKGEAYANVLDMYSDWLISLRYTSGWDVIDIHWPMKMFLENKRLADSSFVIAKDGIHPNSIGHWLIAKQILLSLGANDVSKATTFAEVFLSVKNLDEILLLVGERQRILRNAWLRYTGHKRPGLPEGLPLTEATEKAESLNKEIKELLR